MDDSKEYIEMCSKAKWIQDKWILANGDYLQRATFVGIYSGNQYAYSINLNEHTEQRYIPHSREVSWRIIKTEYTWLPRQDQLQDMFKDLYVDPIPRKLVYALWNWIAKTSPKYDDSMEKLWLGFYMHEKYNKEWVKGEWI